VRAQVLHRQGPIGGAPLHYEEREPRVPGPGELSLAVSACGVCHTDLHIVEGDLVPPHLPLVPGHQVVGRVLARGPGVDTPTLGARVGVGWLAASCGICEACLAGRENLCGAARFTGFHLDGGFAEQLVVPAVACHALPDALDDLHAAPLLCAGIIGYRALRLSGVEPGGRLGLVGFGASAHLTIQIARHLDMRVAVISRREAHRRHARELGAEWAGEFGDTPPFPLDGVVNFTPAGATVAPALALLRPGGVQALAGIHMSPLPAMPYRLLYGERVLRSVANFTAADARELLALAAAIPLRPVARAYPLTEANAALADLAAGALAGSAVLALPGTG
jgi:alcohol dehydrogenase, propanol-preferring